MKTPFTVWLKNYGMKSQTSLLSPHNVRDESNPMPPKRRPTYPCSIVSVMTFVSMRVILYSRCPRRCPPGSSWAFALVHKSWRTKHAARLQPLLATTFRPLGSVSDVEPVETKISSKSVKLVTSHISSNKRPGTYLRSRLRGGGLLEGRQLTRGGGGGVGALISFSFQRDITLLWLYLW